MDSRPCHLPVETDGEIQRLRDVAEQCRAVIEDATDHEGAVLAHQTAELDAAIAAFRLSVITIGVSDGDPAYLRYRDD